VVKLQAPLVGLVQSFGHREYAMLTDTQNIEVISSPKVVDPGSLEIWNEMPNPSLFKSEAVQEVPHSLSPPSSGYTDFNRVFGAHGLELTFVLNKEKTVMLFARATEKSTVAIELVSLVMLTWMESIRIDSGKPKFHL
jgi:hypothetical protein